MTDLYFLKIFFIDKIIPYSLMFLAIAYLMIEIIAPKELRSVFYDFGDRLFFKFIYRPTSKLLDGAKKAFIFNLNKVKVFFNLREKLKIKRLKKKEEKTKIKEDKKAEALLIKNQKREDKLQSKLEKKKSKIENKKLKAEIHYKLKMIFAYNVKRILNKIQSR